MRLIKSDGCNLNSCPAIPRFEGSVTGSDNKLVAKASYGSPKPTGSPVKTRHVAVADASKKSNENYS